MQLPCSAAVKNSIYYNCSSPAHGGAFLLHCSSVKHCSGQAFPAPGEQHPTGAGAGAGAGTGVVEPSGTFLLSRRTIIRENQRTSYSRGAWRNGTAGQTRVHSGGQKLKSSTSISKSSASASDPCRICLLITDLTCVCKWTKNNLLLFFFIFFKIFYHNYSLMFFTSHICT